MRNRALRGVLALLVVAGVFAVALPVLAAPAQNALGIGLRWLGFGGPGSAALEAAEALGMTVEEVWQAKAEGKTLADLAEAKGMTIDDLADKITAARVAEIDKLLGEGKVSEENAQVAKARIEANVSRAITQQCSGNCNGTPGTGGCGYGRNGQAGSGGRGVARGARFGR